MDKEKENVTDTIIEQLRTLDLGGYKIKFKKMSLKETLKYMPLSFKYTRFQIKFGLDRFPRAVAELNEQLEKGKISQAEYEKKAEEIREKETDAQNKMMMAFFSSLDEMESELLFEFLVKSIDEWTFDMPITRESIEKMPHFWVYQMIVFLFTFAFYRGMVEATSFRENSGAPGQTADSNTEKGSGVGN